MKLSETIMEQKSDPDRNRKLFSSNDKKSHETIFRNENQFPPDELNFFCVCRKLF